MKRFEYKRVTAGLISTLDLLGEKGWEVCLLLNANAEDEDPEYLLKREKVDKV